MNLLIVALLAFAACGSDPNVLLTSPPRNEAPTEDVAQSCDLAQRRCSRCHTTGRIVQLHVDRVEDWQGYVHRMRLMPGSAIHVDEEPSIVRCLVYRSFGVQGLAQLQEAP